MEGLIGARHETYSDRPLFSRRKVETIITKDGFPAAKKTYNPDYDYDSDSVDVGALLWVCIVAVLALSLYFIF